LAKRRAIGRYNKLLLIIKDKPDDGIPKINIIIKGDVAGSVEAILDVFNTYGSDDKCRLDVVHYGVGPVNDTDLEMADAFKGKIIHCIINYNYLSSS
jgi:translation initiation factor IF-2